MTLRLYRGDDDDQAPEPSDFEQLPPETPGQMSLIDRYSYFSFPSWGDDDIDLSPYLELCRHLLPNRHEFQPGKYTGGILAVPHPVPDNRDSANVMNSVPWKLSGRFIRPGIGNNMGQILSERVHRVPSLESMELGQLMETPKPKLPQALVTAEHASSVGDERYLLVVPKHGKKTLSDIGQVPGWFQHFGINVINDPREPSPELREEMRDWFSKPDRNLFLLPMEGGRNVAAWQLAVVMYVVDYWSIENRNFEAAHLLANIQGQPNYRKFMTSNK